MLLAGLRTCKKKKIKAYKIINKTSHQALKTIFDNWKKKKLYWVSIQVLGEQYTTEFSGKAQWQHSSYFNLATVSIS